MKRSSIRILVLCATLGTILSCAGGKSLEYSDIECGAMRDSVAYCKAEGKALRNSARYLESIEMHLRGLEFARELEDTLEIVQALNNIGTVYRRMGLLEEAASWHYKALTCCEEWSDKTTPTALKNRVISLNGIGNVHLSMGNHEVAMSAFREALKGETRLGSATGMAINYANIGALLEEDGMLDSARWYYTKSLKCNEESSNELGIALCNNYFGRLSELEGDDVTALKEYGKAYDILLGSTDKWHWLQSCTALSRISIRLGKYRQARAYLDEGLKVAEEAGSLAHIADLSHQNYDLSRNIGEWQRALTWLEKYMEVSDSLAKERNEEEIFALRTEYEHEKNRSEVKHLRQIHRQETRRKNMQLYGLMIIVFLTAVGMAGLIYMLKLRSRNQAILKELDQTRSNYFTNIAHEFRTPLTVILSAARSIHENTLEDDSREDSKDILIHSKELLELVNQVLEVARMTSSIAPAPVWRNGDVVGYVSCLCERYERYAAENGLALVRDFGCRALEMDFVPEMLQRIVGNLISNALKYSRKGTEVTVRLSEEDSDCGGWLKLAVCDEGDGMTAAQLDDIFKPFHRLDVKGGNVGTGIGLYVVKLSAEAMGGSVAVRSVVGRGTVFEVSIPIRHDMAYGTAAGMPECERINSDGTSGYDHPLLSEDAEAPTILIVEDKPEVARWEMRQLDSRYSFHFAADGAEGLQMAQDIVPDLIITDIMMPVMDGLELCRRVRSSELLCHIPVIMVTARVGQEDRIAGLEAGADAYLEKPYDENELAVRVRSLLEQRERLKALYMSSIVSGDGTVCERERSIKDQAFLDRFNEALEAAFLSGKVDCEELASELCIGRVQLNRKIKAITGCKTTEYIQEIRLSKAKNLLDTTPLSIGDIALKCGVEDVGYFSTMFRKSIGMTPTAYRNR